VLGAITQVPSAVAQPGQERDRHGQALLGPLVGAVAERRRGGAAAKAARYADLIQDQAAASPSICRVWPIWNSISLPAPTA
jgi:hypothetical protein